MLIIPREYQTECVGSLYNYFETDNGNPVCALPPGTGKSVIIAMFLESIFRSYPNQKVLVLTHVKELIQQNYGKLMGFWPGAPAGINSAGLGKRDVHDRIIFAGIASVANYAAHFGHVDLVIIDEAHLVSPTDETMYQTFLKGLKSMNPCLKVIGFTATPWRLGQGSITGPGSLFTDICFDITGLESFNRLIAEEYLCPLIPKRTQTQFDLDGVHMRGGEFIPGELQNAVDREEITRKALLESLEMAKDRKHWLIFASGVQHAINIANMLTELGEPCLAVHSKMPSGERDDNIKAFRAGKVRAVVNNNVLTTGFDFPGIDFILMLRATMSAVLWVQMLGRGIRPFPGKLDCLVADFAGNTRRLGPINDPVIPRKKGSKGGGEAPVKECDKCNTWNHASVRFCGSKPAPDQQPGYCGNPFPLAVKLKQEASTEEIIKGDLPVVEVFKVDHITFSEHNKEGRPPAIKVTYYCGLRNFAEYLCFEHEGFASKKARNWWRERTGEEPPVKTADALQRTEALKVATHLRVWVNQKYPTILAHCYDGTAFIKGAVPSDADEGPTVEVAAPRTRTSFRQPSAAQLGIQVPRIGNTALDSLDDDIPF